MKVTWLGQAGLYIESDKAKVMIDPYFSDSVGKRSPEKSRRVPVNESFFDLEPDIMLFSHNHLDHYDPATAPKFLASEKKITVLAPGAAWEEARKCGGVHNYVRLDRHAVWTEKGLRFTAVKADHAERSGVGFVIEELSTGEVFCVTGDTLYNEEIFTDLPEKIDAIFLPINGVGGNMNARDAVRFAERSGAKVAVPIHFGMFDSIDPECFDFSRRVIPEIWKEIPLPVSYNTDL